MAKENIRNDPPPLPPEEQFSEILLVMDKKELTVRAVSEIDKDGKAKTVPADEENQNSFCKTDYNANILSNFFTNFWSQLNDPTRFRFFKLNIGKFKEFNNVLKDFINGHNTPEVKKFLEQYEIKPKEIKQQSSNNKKEDIMAKQQEEKQMSPAEVAKQQEQQAQQAATGGENAPQAYRYNESMIDWGTLGKFGLSREYLERNKLLDGMLKGYKTNVLVPVSANLGAIIAHFDARLSFQQTKEGPVVIAAHGIRQTPNFEKPFYGHIFSEEDKKNLRESGNMGRVVETRDFRTNEPVPSLISLDKLTNEIVGMKAEYVKISDEISGVKLSEQEKADLKAGKKIFRDDFISSRTGNAFSAHLQVNADRKGVEFIFENSNQIFNRQEIGGVKLSDKDIETLNAGKAILVENMKTTDGRTYDSYVHLDKTSGRPVYTSYNPDSPEGARQIIIPKEIGGAPLNEMYREELRKGHPVYLAMTGSDGQPFNRFVKLDLETGRRMYARTPDGFAAQPEYKVPEKIWNVTLNTTQRALLQSGKAAEIKGMKGFDGKPIGPFVKINWNLGKPDFYEQNPDLVKNASQRDVFAEKEAKKQAQGQGNTDEEKPKNQKKRSIAA